MVWYGVCKVRLEVGGSRLEIGSLGQMMPSSNTVACCVPERPG